MATRTVYRIIFNNCMLPDFYFTWDEANSAYKSLKENSCAGYGRIVKWDNESNCII